MAVSANKWHGSLSRGYILLDGSRRVRSEIGMDSWRGTFLAEGHALDDLDRGRKLPGFDNMWIVEAEEKAVGDKWEVSVAAKGLLNTDKPYKLQWSVATSEQRNGLNVEHVATPVVRVSRVYVDSDPPSNLVGINSIPPEEPALATYSSAGRTSHTPSGWVLMGLEADKIPEARNGATAEVWFAEETYEYIRQLTT